MNVSQTRFDRFAPELDVVGLLKSLRSSWRTIVYASAAGLLCAVIYLHVTTFQYTAELKVTAVSRSGEGLGSQIGALGGLASLAGIKLDTGQNGSFQLFVEGLRSRLAADQLSTNMAIMTTVFADSWDRKTNKWRRPATTIGQRIKLALRPAFGLPTTQWHPPGGAELFEYLSDRVRIDEKNDSPVVTVTFSHPDPKFAVLLLSELGRVVDANLRAKALHRANEQIHFLTETLATISVAEHRLAIAQALSEQEKVRIMASSTLPFAADVFDGPSSSPFPTKPKPVLVLFLGIFLGALVAAASVGARYISKDVASAEV